MEDSCVLATEALCRVAKASSQVSHAGFKLEGQEADMAGEPYHMGDVHSLFFFPEGGSEVQGSASPILNLRLH